MPRQQLSAVQAALREMLLACAETLGRASDAAAMGAPAAALDAPSVAARRPDVAQALAAAEQALGHRVGGGETDLSPPPALAAAAAAPAPALAPAAVPVVKASPQQSVGPATVAQSTAVAAAGRLLGRWLALDERAASRTEVLRALPALLSIGYANGAAGYPII
jgi:hypothetical protein